MSSTAIVEAEIRRLGSGRRSTVVKLLFGLYIEFAGM
jgi:hypothetical protein